MLFILNMKSVDLFKLIKAEFPNASIQISDIDYALPKASWLTSTFYDFYKGWRVDHNLNEWTNQNDCDNFASLFYAFSQICHAKSSRSEQGIAVGEFFYGVGGDRVGKGHAINVAVTDKGIINIEPQTGATMPLNKAEKDSAWFIRF